MKGSEEMNEIWKPVVGYEGYYEVSNTGKVRSVDRIVIDKKGRQYFRKGTELKQNIDRGYCRVSITKDGIKETLKVHRLVALAFIPNPDNLPQVNHKDENKQNNNVENLEWVTCKDNQNYGTRTQRSADSHKKSIAMLDKETLKEIKIFNSLQEAAIFLNTPVNASNISRALAKQGRTAYGYRWEYKDQKIDEKKFPQST